MEGTAAAVKAASERGWEAVLLCVIVIAICSLSAYLIKRLLDDASARETRLADRVTNLEKYVESTLLDALEKVTTALTQSNTVSERLVGVVESLATALQMRPCFWTPEKQREFLREGVK